ncbi:hypothetical protein V1511DRAFT_420903 [Dipodascopsis uninucleata]
MAKQSDELGSGLDGESVDARTPLMIDMPAEAPPPYSASSPKTPDEQSRLLVRTPFSPEYYDEYDADSYFGIPVRRKRPLFIRIVKALKWPAITALVLGFITLITVLAVQIVEVNAPATYVRQALNLNITSISVEDLSREGVKSRVQGEISFDSSKVDDSLTRNLGRFATSIMRKAEVKETYLYIARVESESNRKVIGRASIPNIVVDIRDKHVTPIDFVSNVEDIASVQEIAKLVEQYLQGHLQGALFRGDADITIRSGILPLGTHHVSHEVKLTGCLHFKYIM